MDILRELDVPTCCRTDERSARPSTFCISFFAPLVSRLSSWIILINLQYVQHVFLALCTRVQNTIACVCRRRVEAGGFQLVYGWRVFIAGGIRVGEGDVPAFFSGSACVRLHVETVIF